MKSYHSETYIESDGGNGRDQFVLYRNRQAKNTETTKKKKHESKAEETLTVIKKKKKKNNSQR